MKLFQVKSISTTHQVHHTRTHASLTLQQGTWQQGSPTFIFAFLHSDEEEETTGSLQFLLVRPEFDYIDESDEEFVDPTDVNVSNKNDLRPFNCVCVCACVRVHIKCVCVAV